MEVQEHTEAASAAENQEQASNHEQVNNAERRRGRGAEHGGTNSVTLGPRDQLVGRLVIDGDLRVLGTVEGEIQASGDISIEERATVRASIEGRNVHIRGEVNGDTTARERLSLAGSGSLNGNVRVSRIAIEDGATLNGNVTMQREGSGGA